MTLRDDLHKRPPNERELELAKIVAIQQESDRGCVIVCAALIEEDLEKLLRIHCRQDPKVVKQFVDPLFRAYAPLSTFSAKIQISYVMGLIGNETQRALELLRHMRNDFAHERKAVSFQTSKYQSRLQEFLRIVQRKPVGTKKKVESDDDAKMPGFGNLTKGEFVDRLAFLLCISQLSVRVLVEHEYLNRETQKRD